MPRPSVEGRPWAFVADVKGLSEGIEHDQAERDTKAASHVRRAGQDFGHELIELPREDIGGCIAHDNERDWVQSKALRTVFPGGADTLVN